MFGREHHADARAGGSKKIVLGYCDIDWSPSKDYVLKNKDKKGVVEFFNHAVAKKPREELYDLSIDPQCMNNLAFSKKRSNIELLKSMKDKMFKYLKGSNDSRLSDNPDIWDTYPYFGTIREYPVGEDCFIKK